MGVVNEAVEDGIGEGGIAEVGVPAIDGELAGDEGGAFVVTILQEFEQITLMRIGKRGESEVIDDQELGLGEVLEQETFLAQRIGFGEFLDKAWQAQIAHTDLVLAGVMGERAGEIAFANAGGSNDQHIEALFDPTEVGELRQNTFVQAAWSALIDVFEAGVLLRQFGPTQTLCIAIVGALQLLMIEQQGEAFVEAQISDRGLCLLSLECARHAA